MTLQEGIYHRTRPGAFFGILFLRVDPEQPAKHAGAILAELWARYDQLRRGDLPQLPGHPVPDGDLTVLIGFGFNLFARDDIQRSAPPELERFGRFRSPEPGGGGLLLTGTGLHYATDVTKNPATEDVVIQFIANSQLAVNRAIVETWDLLTTSQPVVAGAAPPSSSAPSISASSTTTVGAGSISTTACRTCGERSGLPLSRSNLPATPRTPGPTAGRISRSSGPRSISRRGARSRGPLRSGWSAGTSSRVPRSSASRGATMSPSSGARCREPPR